MEHIIIIGGGIGGAIAHDLSLRGFRVTLFEKGELVSGTTGRHHGLLHSGARYVLHDIETARECMVENQILRRIAPQGLEQNDGLFIALSEEDMAHCREFKDHCLAAGIPAEEIKPSRALVWEPNLNPELKAAFRVPDATMDAWRLPMHFFATARSNGADIRPYSEVVDIITNANNAIAVKVFDHRIHQAYTTHGDLIINAAGPWAGRIVAMLGIKIPVRPVPGVMVGVAERLTNMVINRLHPANDGDIIIPQRQLSLLGTTAWLGDDPDDIDLPKEQVLKIVELCSELVPRIASMPVHSAWMASRPVIVTNQNEDPTKISRTFDCIDHANTDGIEGFISIFGGKATTMRAMAEVTADQVCKKTGRDIECKTRDSVLLHYRNYFSALGAEK